MTSSVANNTIQKKVNLTACSRRYFEEAETVTDENGVTKKRFTCKECQANINGTYASNLVSHLKKHKELFAKITEDKSIEEKRAKMLLGCVEFVAVDGHPFSHLNGSGFLSIIDDTLKELEEAGQAINLKDPHLTEVKEMLHKTAKSVQQKIREELHNRPFSLMVDITTKRRRSILGISAQFLVDGKHKIRSIGMVELKESHTGEYLARVICELLSKYGVKPQQVVSITTDNGANVVKMIRDMASEMVVLENACQDQLACEQEAVMDVFDAEIANYLETVPDYTDLEALNIIFEQTDSDDETDDVVIEEQENLLNAMVANLQVQNGPIWEVQGIRCAAHTLQLCIKFALKNISTADKNIITLCRRIAKTMRLKSTIDELNMDRVKYSIPRLDVETRWSSTYSMVNNYLLMVHIFGF